jgi:hypothetical protein
MKIAPIPMPWTQFNSSLRNILAKTSVSIATSAKATGYKIDTSIFAIRSNQQSIETKYRKSPEARCELQITDQRSDGWASRTLGIECRKKISAIALKIE